MSIFDAKKIAPACNVLRTLPINGVEGKQKRAGRSG
ncbi:hypothetical protein SAMN05443144_101233 [Fodinibius roseus]|uniref:Uncharacterized protein n=1 Tax=Fodinibius roseus TaxID=1194090 RepID=A0A1M4T872_9BACT|nr:hypothetical protein SAMN05443144_101233 [Fodinibius roseus]